MTRVSIVMPCYNAGQYLREALDSIVAQSYADFELLLVDSSSSDNTQDILSSYQDKRIKLLSLPVKCGDAMPRNIGIMAARGDYVANMDGDDIMNPERLKTQVTYMEQHPTVDVLGSCFTLFHKGHRSKRQQPLSDGDIKAYFLFVNGNAIHNPTVMIKRSFLMRHHTFYPPFDVDSDHGLWLKCVELGGVFANVDEDLLDYRRHEGNLSRAAPERTDQTKHEIRRALLGLYFPDLSTRDCDQIALCMGQLDQVPVESCFAGMQAMELALGFRRCSAGANIETLFKIIGFFRKRCIKHINGVLRKKM